MNAVRFFIGGPIGSKERYMFENDVTKGKTIFWLKVRKTDQDTANVRILQT